jgi:hypothetical protein
LGYEHSIYQHVKRPEWGMSEVLEMHEDRTTFLFDDGQQRTIKRDHVHMMQNVALDADAAAEVHKKIAKYAPTKPGGPPRTRKKRAPAKAGAAAKAKGKAAAAAAAATPITADE